MILDVGCGRNKRPGAIGVDSNRDTAADVIADKVNFGRRSLSGVIFQGFPRTRYNRQSTELRSLMPLPDYQSAMLPLLQLAGDGQEHSLQETCEILGHKLGLTDAEKAELLPSGRQTVFYSRVGWAKTYLHQAGLLKSPRRGRFCITERGIDLLSENPKKITVRLLERYPEFQEFRARRGDGATKQPQEPSGDETTPEESLESAYGKIRGDLAVEILSEIKQRPPQFFEKLVVELLLKMGYGGSRRDAGRSLGRVGDEGIDGIINEDRLGLDVIYIQAKRWEGTVGRPEIQRFVGALHAQRARKGVFITTGSFSHDAEDYVERIDPKVVLIDGSRLAELMIDYHLGVSTVATYEIKRVDSDYFADE